MDPLKYIVTSEDDLPEDEKLRELYVKEGDKWVLNVQGVVPKKQVDEFRTENVKLRKEVEKFKGIDPEEVPAKLQRLTEVEEELEALKDTDKNKVKELVEQRTNEMKTAHEKQLKALQDEAAGLRSNLKTLKIDQQITESGAGFGLRNGAAPDLVARARSVFDLDDDGNIVARDADGQQIFNKAGEPLSPNDWVESMTKDAAHLFDPNEGTGSKGGAKGGGPLAGTNPWKKETFNMTEQGRILKEDPERARRLAAQAGKVI